MLKSIAAVCVLEDYEGGYLDHFVSACPLLLVLAVVVAMVDSVVVGGRSGCK